MSSSLSISKRSRVGGEELEQIRLKQNSEDRFEDMIKVFLYPDVNDLENIVVKGFTYHRCTS